MEEKLCQNAVTGDMMVMVNYKLRKIKEVYDELPISGAEDGIRTTFGATTLSNHGPEHIDWFISHNSGKNVYRISTEHCSVDVLESQQVVVFLDCDIVFMPANELQVGDKVMDVYGDHYHQSPITSIECLGPVDEPVYSLSIYTPEKLKNIYFANKILICGTESDSMD